MRRGETSLLPWFLRPIRRRHSSTIPRALCCAGNTVRIPSPGLKCPGTTLHGLRTVGPAPAGGCRLSSRRSPAYWRTPCSPLVRRSRAPQRVCAVAQWNEHAKRAPHSERSEEPYAKRCSRPAHVAVGRSHPAEVHGDPRPHHRRPECSEEPVLRRRLGRRSKEYPGAAAPVSPATKKEGSPRRWNDRDLRSRRIPRPSASAREAERALHPLARTARTVARSRPLFPYTRNLATWQPSITLPRLPRFRKNVAIWKPAPLQANRPKWPPAKLNALAAFHTNNDAPPRNPVPASNPTPGRTVDHGGSAL
jgi:hypothetical protein